MHPEILHELVSQHGRELREQAHRATVARTVSQARRRQAVKLAAEAAGPVIPAIPDYVDGSFLAAADEASDRVPAARRAA